VHRSRGRAAPTAAFGPRERALRSCWGRPCGRGMVGDDDVDDPSPVVRGMTSTNKQPVVTVGTTKKSAAMIWPTWLARNVRHGGDGGDTGRKSRGGARIIGSAGRLYPAGADFKYARHAHGSAYDRTISPMVVRLTFHQGTGLGRRPGRNDFLGFAIAIRWPPAVDATARILAAIDLNNAAAVRRLTTAIDVLRS
jgi:hypothetical protein